jgi:hypothetical protein
LKVGVGYQSFDFQSDDADFDCTLSSWINAKVGLGATFFVMSFDKWGSLGAGLDLDYAILSPGTIERCDADGNDCDDSDVDSDEAELILGKDWKSDDVIMLNLHVTYVLPVI